MALGGVAGTVDRWAGQDRSSGDTILYCLI